MEKLLSEAVAILKNGGAIVYPTETVYGLGGNALDQVVVEKIFKIKGRVKNKPLIVLVKDLLMAGELCEVDSFEGVLRRYWPGALTGIFKARKEFPKGVLKNGRVAIRVSPHPVTIKLFKMIDLPLISTSANRSGGENCLDIEQVKKSLGERYKMVDFVIDGGKIPSSPPSTLIDFTVTPPKVLRQGNVIYSPYAGY